MDLHGQIMRIRANVTADGKFRHRSDEYNEGHRDARHAAAELALKADAEIKRMRGALFEIGDSDSSR